jgi:hypothetical protein
MESDVTLYTQYVKKWFQKRLSISQAQYVEGVYLRSHIPQTSILLMKRHFRKHNFTILKNFLLPRTADIVLQNNF